MIGFITGELWVEIRKTDVIGRIRIDLLENDGR